jgi:hypothetical protein
LKSLSLPGFHRLRMHTQLKLLPASNYHHQIQQAAGIHSYDQETTTNKQYQLSNKPVAYVEFRDASSAGRAMQMLQGKYLLSSDRGAMRIEYAKSKMAAVTNEHFIHQHQTAYANGY